MRKKSALRENDVKMANIITEFLEYYFYQTETDKYEIVKDKYRQVMGIDSIFTMNGTEYICDEKSAIRYINKELNTYSFELSFIGKDGRTTDGWLINEGMANNSYLLVWVDKARKDIIDDVTDIDCLTMALVRKERIMEYLAERGLDKESLEIKMCYLRSNPYESRGNIARDGYKFSYSEHLVEKPINVIIPKDELLKMADFKDTIELEEE